MSQGLGEGDKQGRMRRKAQREKGRRTRGRAGNFGSSSGRGTSAEGGKVGYWAEGWANDMLRSSNAGRDARRRASAGKARSAELFHLKIHEIDETGETTSYNNRRHLSDNPPPFPLSSREPSASSALPILDILP
jgi:hypothetical protein